MTTPVARNLKFEMFSSDSYSIYIREPLLQPSLIIYVHKFGQMGYIFEDKGTCDNLSTN